MRFRIAGWEPRQILKDTPFDIQRMRIIRDEGQQLFGLAKRDLELFANLAWGSTINDVIRDPEIDDGCIVMEQGKEGLLVWLVGSLSGLGEGISRPPVQSNLSLNI